MWNLTDQVQVSRNDEKIKILFFFGENPSWCGSSCNCPGFSRFGHRKEMETSIFLFLSLNFLPLSLTESVNLNTVGATFESLKALWLEVHSIAFAMITRIIESLRHLTWQRLLSCEVTSSSLCLCTECIQALASVGISTIDPNVCWCST